MSNLKMPKRLFSKSGFTLVELMVVVAIIGILAAVAIPNYQKYQARARQSEAKVMLASAYTALQSYFAEVGSYTQCLNPIGFESTTGAKRYYTVGITDGGTNNCGPNGTQNCLAYVFDNLGTGTLQCSDMAGTTFYLATASMGGGGVTVEASLSNDGVSQTAFTVQAVGRVSANPATGPGSTDSWTVDNAKNMVNNFNGV